MPASYYTVDVHDILRALEFSRHDRNFAVGSVVLRRKDGWPMGGHMSAAATSVTLEYSIAMLYKYKERFQKLQWHTSGLTAQKTFKVYFMLMIVLSSQKHYVISAWLME